MGSFFSSFGPRTVASLTTLPSWTQLGYVVGVTVLTVGGGGLVAYYTDFVHPVHDYNPPWPFPPTKNTNYKKKKLYTNKERCVSLLKPFSAYIFPALLEEILWRGAYVVLLLCCVVVVFCMLPVQQYFFKHIDFDYVILVMKYINKNVYCSNMLISSSVILLTVPVSGIPISSSYFLCTNHVCIMLKTGMLCPNPAVNTELSTGVLWGWSLGICLAHVLVHPLAGWTCWPRGRTTFQDYRFLLLATICLGGATSSYLLSNGSVYCAAFTHWIPVVAWRDFFNGEAKLGITPTSTPPTPTPFFSHSDQQQQQLQASSVVSPSSPTAPTTEESTATTPLSPTIEMNTIGDEQHRHQMDDQNNHSSHLTFVTARVNSCSSVADDDSNTYGSTRKS